MPVDGSSLPGFFRSPEGPVNRSDQLAVDRWSGATEVRRVKRVNGIAGLNRRWMASMGWTVVATLGLVLAGAGVVRYRMGPKGLEMPASQLAERLGRGDCVVLDVRSAREYRSGHIPGAIHIPYTRVAGRLDEVHQHRDGDIVIYCEAGVRARIAQNTLAKAGFQRVHHLIGDMAGWRRENRVVATAAGQ